MLKYFFLFFEGKIKYINQIKPPSSSSTRNVSKRHRKNLNNYNTIPDKSDNRKKNENKLRNCSLTTPKGIKPQKMVVEKESSIFCFRPPKRPKLHFVK